MSKDDPKADVWMPVTPGDYYRDTNHLTTAQHGAYFLLLMHAWVANGLLPDDDEALRSVTRMDKSDWRRSRKALLAFFKPTEAGYRHKRIDIELAKADRNLSQKSVAGKASAFKRAEQRKANGASTAVEIPLAEITIETPTADPTADPTAMLRQFNSSPSPIPRKKEPPSVDAAASTPDARTMLFRDGVMALRHMTGKPDATCRSLIGRWLKQAGDDCAAVHQQIAQAMEDRRADPVAWITAALKPAGGTATSTWASFLSPDTPSPEFDLELVAE